MFLLEPLFINGRKHGYMVNNVPEVEAAVQCCNK